MTRDAPATERLLRSLQEMSTEEIIVALLVYSQNYTTFALG